jgi:hypothetical protein
VALINQVGAAKVSGLIPFRVRTPSGNFSLVRDFQGAQGSGASLKIEQNFLMPPSRINGMIELDFNLNIMYNSNVYIIIVHYQREKYGSNTGLSNRGRKKQS